MLGVLALLLVSAPAAQQNQNQNQNWTGWQRTTNQEAAAKPTPKMANGKPDFTGYYINGVAGVSNAQAVGDSDVITRAPDGSVFFAYGGAGAGVEAAEDGNTVEDQAERNRNPAPYKPEYEAKVKDMFKYSYGPRDNLLDPNLDCKPAGPLRSPLGIMHIIHNPQGMAILYEAAPGPSYRVIYTDGRKHPERWDSSYMGHSIGYWEGDTLVVDTVGLNDETWMGNVTASIHSDQVHLVERFTRKGDEVTYQATIEDPVMFTRPWVKGEQKIVIGPADDRIQPQMCRGDSKKHQIVNTPEDTFRCNWCNTQEVYGIDSQEFTVPKGEGERRERE
jgi:hypothetical protein